MKIPASILEPFGYTGIPFIRMNVDPEYIDAIMDNLVTYMCGMTDNDICDALEATAVLLGANAVVTRCVHIEQFEGLTRTRFLLGYIMHNSTEVRHIRLDP